MKYIELNACKAAPDLHTLVDGTNKQCIICMMINYNFCIHLWRDEFKDIKQ